MSELSDAELVVRIHRALMQEIKNLKKSGNILDESAAEGLERYIVDCSQESPLRLAKLMREK